MATRTRRSLGISLLPAVLTALAASVAPSAAAQVIHIDLPVVESPALGGRSFGTVGQYERLRGIAYGAVDPSDPRNSGIVNIENAPRDARGRVEYRTVVEIYRPVDMSRWNGAIYHTVPNRGGAGAAEDALLEMGFALVRVGWQGDIAPTSRNIVASLPIARQADGSSIAGPALEEFIFNDDDPVSIASLSYQAASLDPARAHLTVRERQDDPRATPDDLAWSYVNAGQIRIERPAGYDGGAIYEFVYDAKNPTVMGLGFAAMRDVISFLRYEAQDEAGVPNPLASSGLPRTALSIGISQSGRYLRDFLYQGFNEDTEGRIVFDGMHPNIAGSRKTFTNYAFSQPGRWQKQHEDHLYPGDQFPFTYTTLTDAISGRTDGLLEKCSASNTCPKIIHSDGEAEIWQARSSLIVTDALGKPIELPDNVRVYLLAGTQHGGGRGVGVATPSAGICQNLNNPLSMAATRLALSVDLYEWVADGKEPPPSRFPTAGNDGLVPAGSLDFPKIPGVTYSGSYDPLSLMDYSSVPAVPGKPYTVLVGRVDEDGNMIDGVRSPSLQAPIGTFTGWNLRRDGFGEGDQCAGTGSFIPFAANRAEREASGDPRLSLAERYPTHDDYVSAVSDAADELVRERLLLPRDAEEFVRRAEESGVSTED
jgi:hypothetical protein